MRGVFHADEVKFSALSCVLSNGALEGNSIVVSIRPMCQRMQEDVAENLRDISIPSHVPAEFAFELAMDFPKLTSISTGVRGVHFGKFEYLVKLHLSGVPGVHYTHLRPK